MVKDYFCLCGHSINKHDIKNYFDNMGNYTSEEYCQVEDCDCDDYENTRNRL